MLGNACVVRWPALRSQLRPGTKTLQRAPAGIDLRLGTGTVCIIPVFAAAGAKSFAIFPAERAIGQGKQHLLTHDIFQQKTALFIIPDFGLSFADGALTCLGIGAAGTEDQVEPQIGMMTDRVKAARAQQLEHPAAASPDTNVHDDLPRSAVLFNAIRSTFDVQRARLPHVRCIVDHTRGNVQFERKWVRKEVSRGNTHRILIISA